jgi:hypothetical protein
MPILISFLSLHTQNVIEPEIATQLSFNKNLSKNFSYFCG